MSEHKKGRPSLVGAAERRSEARTATVFRPVLIETEKLTGFCLVRNLSETGLMGNAYTNFADNLAVKIHFGQDTSIAGTLVWCAEGRVGVRFNEAIDVDTILSQLAAKIVNGKLNRAPRLKVRCKGKLVIGDRLLAVEVQDVSQRGIKIIASFIRPGDELYVEMVGLERRKAVVRWAQEGVAGLHFLCPLSFDQLANWAVAQQNGQLPEFHAARVS